MRACIPALVFGIIQPRSGGHDSRTRPDGCRRRSRRRDIHYFVCEIWNAAQAGMPFHDDLMLCSRCCIHRAFSNGLECAIDINNIVISKMRNFQSIQPNIGTDLIAIAYN